MLELATNKTAEVNDVIPKVEFSDVTATVEEKPEVVDGVDERTGKIVELTPNS